MRWLVALGGLIGSILLTLPGTGQTTRALDEQLLRAAQVPLDDAGLLEFLRLRTLSADDPARIEKLVAQLGSSAFREREQAGKQLLMRGPIAVPYLHKALKDAALEVIRRAENLIKAIEAMGPDVPVAAARRLAQNQTAGAVEVLLGYLPFAPDEWTEAEVLACIGQLTIRHGKVDGKLVQALHDPYPPLRASAVYVLGRRADIGHREAVRLLLADPDPLVRQRTALSLVGNRLPQMLRDSAPHDEELLKKQNLGLDEPSLLAFLRERTLDDDDQKRLRRLIHELGASVFRVRNDASRQLIKAGTPALGLLRGAETSPDAEVARRARLCVEEIRKGPGAALPIAVAHQLARSTAKGIAPAAALRVLVDYLPFADDESVEEEVVNVLTVLAARDVAVDPALSAALADPAPARRGAAALVLGRVGVVADVPGLRKLLDDPVPAVRFRAAQGLVAAKDKVAVPRLITLLNDLPSRDVWQVEYQLQRLAGDQSPSVAVGEGSPVARARAVKAWDEWWSMNASTIDLTRTSEAHAFLGLYTICEYDSAAGMPGGQVWETARDGSPRWKIAGMMGAMDAQLLPGGNILVAENSANRITERAKDGSIKWEFRVAGNPIACQRLANGNTFIASYNQVMEIDAQSKTLYAHNRDPAFYIFSAQKLKNGRILCITAQGMILELDSQSGKELRSINLGPNGGWCSVEALATGRYLVATMTNNQVREIDLTGKTHWQATFPGVFRASRLPNGHTLVASMTTKKVAELDRNGQTRWEKTCEGRPWSVHWR